MIEQIKQENDRLLSLLFMAMLDNDDELKISVLNTRCLNRVADDLMNSNDHAIVLQWFIKEGDQ